MRHNVQRRIELGVIAGAPRTEGGYKKKDHGQLPDSHPIIRELGDHNHRTRGYCKQLFTWARSNLTVSKLTSGDAERIKGNHSYWLKQGIRDGVSFAQFCESADAVVEHHFNNHTHCGEWCQWLKASPKDRLELEKKYRCKEINKKMYEQVLSNHNKFMKQANLRQLYHPHNTNSCEGFMWSVASLCPKTKHLCGTKNYEGRWVIIVTTIS